MKTASQLVLEYFQNQRQALSEKLKAELIKESPDRTELLVCSKTIRQIDIILRKLNKSKLGGK